MEYNYVTHGSTITVQTAILKDFSTDELLVAEKEKMKEELIERIQNIPSSDMVVEEDRANCKYLTIKCEIE